MGSSELKKAFNLDVSPILAMARYRHGAGLEPLELYRQINYRKQTVKKRPRDPNASGSGIV